MTDGYAANRAGNLPLFNAMLILEQMDRLPERFARDLDYVRLTLDLSDAEFEAAVELCERREWIHWSDSAPDPMH